MGSEDCVFCKIVDRQIPTKFIKEDDNVVVFEDLHPMAPVHLLIVPKKHIRSINDLVEEERPIVSAMIMAAKEMAKKMKVNESGYRLFFNVEKGGGQEIFHVHLHLIGGWK